MMVEFTAAWCLTCKLNLVTAINTERVKQVVEENGVEPLLADWTSRDDVIKKALAELDSASIPLLAIYPANDPDNVIKNKDRMAPPDAAILTNQPEVGQMFRTSQIESMRNGTEGAAQEIQLFTQHWGFELTDITFPIVLWYGKDDVNTPLAMGHHMDDLLPNSTLNIIPNEAHFSLINNHIDTIFAGLLSSS